MCVLVNQKITVEEKIEIVTKTDTTTIAMLIRGMWLVSSAFICICYDLRRAALKKIGIQHALFEYNNIRCQIDLMILYVFFAMNAAASKNMYLITNVSPDRSMCYIPLQSLSDSDDGFRYVGSVFQNPKAASRAASFMRSFCYRWYCLRTV